MVAFSDCQPIVFILIDSGYQSSVEWQACFRRYIPLPQRA
jgi:hypothetical protein